MLSRRTRAFTLIEIMIVVAIIGILAGIMVPNFVKARQEAHLSACQENLKHIGEAWMIYKVRHDTPTDLQELVDSGCMPSIPKCPAAGTSTYTIGYTDGEKFTCVYCRGNYHSGMGARDNYPRWYEYRGMRTFSQNE